MSIDVEIARKFAQEVRDNRQPRTWRKVTTIMDAFSVYRLTDGVRTRISNALSSAGLHTEPSMMSVDRSARISLSLGHTEEAPTAGDAFPGEPLPGVTYWEHGDTDWTVAKVPNETRGVLLVDVDLSKVGKPKALFDSLPARLRGLDDEALEDVLTPDHRASFKRAVPGTATRQASLFIITADENVSVEDETAVMLSLGLIEFAVGRDWILIARHPSQTYVSGSPADHIQAAAPSAARYVASLQDCGLAKSKTADAAALAVITQAVDSFGTARTELASYVDTWRTEFAQGSSDKSLLVNLQATLPLVVDALEPLRRPTVVRWLDSEPKDRARELTDHVDRNLDALHNLQTTTADALAQADQHQNELYQGSLATLAAVLLAPALVASIFGANEMLTQSPYNLIWLFVAMILAGFFTNLAIRRRTAHHRKPTRPLPATNP